jgi:hypothetical protein
MFNFIEKLKDYTTRRDNTDMIVRSWVSENNSAYADFKRRIDAIAHGDISVLEQIGKRLYTTRGFGFVCMVE